jgi:tRNA nucleotidyltransferase (CCA-adding enzyme)
MSQKLEVNINKSNIPKYVTHVTETLEKAGFEAFLVGGCVRDLILKREPKDWDITTNALPEQIIPLFDKTIYENTFGTVGVCVPRVTLGSLETEVKYDIIEVTPYRMEGKYTDKRHPDEISFSNSIKDDLKRRDFTINALAYSVSQDSLIDEYKGQEDIKDKLIRTVGLPDERFGEDALRLLRAVRFSTELDFVIEGETLSSISKNSELIKSISSERIRDEFTKIIESKNSARGIGILQKLGLLRHIIPELEEGIGCKQGGAHIYDVFEHLLGALQHATDKGDKTEIRLAALFHDIGKPKSKRTPSNKAKPTFYGHEVIGAKMAKVIMDRLKYPKDTTDLVTKLVRYHMFFSDTEQITLSAVRRTIQNIGPDHIWDLMEVRECDRVGMKKKEAPYRLRKYHAMIEEALRDPISVKQLKVDGSYLMNELKIKAGPRMGWMLNALLEEVLDEPKKNEIEYLSERVGELDKLTDAELKSLGEQAKNKKEELEEEEIQKLQKKHGV